MLRRSGERAAEEDGDLHSRNLGRPMPLSQSARGGHLRKEVATRGTPNLGGN